MRERCKSTMPTHSHTNFRSLHVEHSKTPQENLFYLSKQFMQRQRGGKPRFRYEEPAATSRGQMQ